VNQLQSQVDHLTRLNALKDEQHTIDEEAKRLRDEKIVAVEEQLSLARQSIAELKAAGTADADALKAVKQEVKLCESEVKKLRLTGWLQGRLGFLFLIVAFIGGVYVGAR
jgi:hypothetical protein